MFKVLFGDSRSKNEGATGTRLKMLQKLQLNLTLVCMVSIGTLLIFSIFSAIPLKDERVEDINQTTNAIGFEVKSIPFFPSRIDAQINLVNTSLRADFRLIDEGNNTLFTSRDGIGEKPNKYYISLSTKSGRYYLLIENVTAGTLDRIDLQKQSIQVHYIININFLASLYPYIVILCLIAVGVVLALLYRAHIVKKLVEGETKKLAVSAGVERETLQQTQYPQMQSDNYPTSYGSPQPPTQPYYPPYPIEAGGEAGKGQYYPPAYQYPGFAQGPYPQQGGDENIPQESPEHIVSQQPPKVMDKKRTVEEKKRLSKPPAPAEKVTKERIGDRKDIEYETRQSVEKPTVVKCQLCGFENELKKPNIGTEAKCQVCGHIIITPKSKQTF
jgi:DNA-directed RNA polymerase subunit RPC12/RpoP